MRQDVIDVVIGFYRLAYGHVEIRQLVGAQLDGQGNLIPMGPRYWIGHLRTLLPLSIGDWVQVGDFLAGLTGQAVIFKTSGHGTYWFNGSGPLVYGEHTA